MVKPMFDQIPQVAEKPGKYEIHFRKNGKKVSFDVVNNEGKLVEPILGLGLDFTEYHKFNFGIKTGINLGNIFDVNADHYKNVSDGNFGTNCGTKKPEAPKAKFCTNCGAKIEEGTKFCPECGTKVE